MWEKKRDFVILHFCSRNFFLKTIILLRFKFNFISSISKAYMRFIEKGGCKLFKDKFLYPVFTRAIFATIFLLNQILFFHACLFL